MRYVGALRGAAAGSAQPSFDLRSRETSFTDPADIISFYFLTGGDCRDEAPSR